MKIIGIILLTIASALLYNSYSLSETKKSEVVQLDMEFYSRLVKSNPLSRDTFLNELQGGLFQGRGYVESVTKSERYHRHFRITAIENSAGDFNVRLYIFTDNEEYLNLLKKGDLFDFKGQFVVFTPLNSRRDSYIFDIILEEGALSVK